MKKIYIQPRIETVATTPQQILCTSGGIRAEISGYGKSSGGFTQMPVWLAGIICSSLLFLGTACSSNNPDQPKQQAELKPRTLIVTEVESQKSKVERRLPQATITDAGETLNALWSKGDEISFRNISHATYTPSGSTDPVSLEGVLLADRAARIASFASNDKVWCDEGDQLVLVYPKTTAPAFEIIGTNPLTARYTISLTPQDGSLATIANKYHHSYGFATVTEVTETTANAELSKMQNLLTVCKFSFVDETHPATPLPVSSLSISYGDGDYAGTYPETATVTVTQGTPCTVAMTPVKKSKAAGGNVLSILPDGNPKEVYVALFPEANPTKYFFQLESGSEIYTGTATAQLIAGEYVVAKELKLTKKVNP